MGSEIGNRESGIGNRESGMGNGESGIARAAGWGAVEGVGYGGGCRLSAQGTGRRPLAGCRRSALARDGLHRDALRAPHPRCAVIRALSAGSRICRWAVATATR
ncbi:hypothetical protein EIQ06_05630 [Xanthomonas campestris pv. campestris]|nr:hypothetical protein D0A42_18680 [Xanthomonas campestris pv. campestris]RFF74354.1 hypothetical protein DZE36_11530 [Xanthomonas campestris pv. campestris]